MSGDRARVSISVRVPQEVAFRVFSEDIDRWWRRGLKYRVARGDRGILVLEAGVGGRLIESFETKSSTKVVQTGTVRVWEPPGRLVFTWRGVAFGPEDADTEVEVRFEPTPTGTLVTVIHSGWSQIRDDHPAKHGLVGAALARSIGLWWGDLLTGLRLHLTPPVHPSQEPE